jgi:hypothetical protein
MWAARGSSGSVSLTESNDAEATRDTGIKTELSHLRPPLPVVELNTEFKVLSLLKGNVSSGTLVLRHYRLDTDRIRGGCLNCGSQLDFTTTGRMRLDVVRETCRPSCPRRATMSCSSSEGVTAAGRVPLAGGALRSGRLHYTRAGPLETSSS